MSGTDFAYRVNGQDLSFGDIIALSGDYFFHWHYTYCAESISDYWNTNRERSIKTGIKNAKTLKTDYRGYLKCVLSHIKVQATSIRKTVQEGKDAAQVW